MNELESWDFGFTAVNETELESVQTAASVASIEKEKTDKIYKAILPLLAKLKADSQKDYIYWPNRVENVENFEKRLTELYKS